jgi:indolepyruvate ferredoxin oxidoreductase alpha subunit
MVTRVSHTRGIVTFGPIQRRKTGTFVRDPKRFVNVPENARGSHRILLEKMNRAREISERSVHNKISGAGEFGLVTSGASYNYCVEALQLIGVTARMLKIGMINPPPKKLILKFLQSIQEVGIVEELEPILEDQVRVVAGELDRRVKVYGKREEYFPRYGELSVRLVAAGLAKILGRTLPFNYEEIARKAMEVAKTTPPRPPLLCPGCPHTASFHAIKAATNGKAIVATDIGCYTLGFQSPLSVGDIFLCMGASAGLAAGFSKFTNDPVLGVVGDSTFLHGSIPGLINAAYNNHKFVYVVLDNLTTAMTGHQPHPGTGVTATGKQSKRIMIEDVAKACGIEYVKVVDPFEHQTAIQTIQEALRQRGPSVVVFRRPCVQIKAPAETILKNKTGLPTTSAESDDGNSSTVNRFWSCEVI